MIVAGLEPVEPAIFGSEVQRLIHWATRPCLRKLFLGEVFLVNERKMITSK